jgi:hypothetical protein
MSEEQEEYGVSEYNILLAENRKLKMELEEVVGKYEEAARTVHSITGQVNKLQKALVDLDKQNERPALIDKFAMSVIAGVLTETEIGESDKECIVELAYSYAQQMQKERQSWI